MEMVVYGVPGVVVKFSKLKNIFIYFVYEGYYKYYATVHSTYLYIHIFVQKETTSIFFWFFRKIAQSYSLKYRLIQIETN